MSNLTARKGMPEKDGDSLVGYCARNLFSAACHAWWKHCGRVGVSGAR